MVQAVNSHQKSEKSSSDAEINESQHGVNCWRLSKFVFTNTAAIARSEPSWELWRLHLSERGWSLCQGTSHIPRSCESRPSPWCSSGAVSATAPTAA